MQRYSRIVPLKAATLLEHSPKEYSEAAIESTTRPELCSGLNLKDNLEILIWFTDPKNLTLWNYNRVFASIKITRFIPRLQKYSLKLLIFRISELISSYEKKVDQYGSPERVPIYDNMGPNLPVFVYFYRAFKLSRVASWVLNSNSAENDTIDRQTGIRNISVYEYFFPKEESLTIDQVKDSLSFVIEQPQEKNKQKSMNTSYSRKYIYDGSNPCESTLANNLPLMPIFSTKLQGYEPQCQNDYTCVYITHKMSSNNPNVVDQKVRKFMLQNPYGYNTHNDIKLPIHGTELGNMNPSNISNPTSITKSNTRRTKYDFASKVPVFVSNHDISRKPSYYSATSLTPLLVPTRAIAESDLTENQELTDYRRKRNSFDEHILSHSRSFNLDYANKTFMPTHQTLLNYQLATTNSPKKPRINTSCDLSRFALRAESK